MLYQSMSVRLPIACALAVVLPPLCFILESQGRQTGQQAAHSNVIQQASFSLALDLGKRKREGEKVQKHQGEGDEERKLAKTQSKPIWKEKYIYMCFKIHML